MRSVSEGGESFSKAWCEARSRARSTVTAGANIATRRRAVRAHSLQLLSLGHLRARESRSTCGCGPVHAFFPTPRFADAGRRGVRPRGRRGARLRLRASGRDRAALLVPGHGGRGRTTRRGPFGSRSWRRATGSRSSSPTGTSSFSRSWVRSSRGSCRCRSTRRSRFKNIEAYHETVAHIARAAGVAMLLTTATARPFVDGVQGRVEGLRVDRHDRGALGIEGDDARHGLSRRPCVPPVHVAAARRGRRASW